MSSKRRGCPCGVLFSIMILLFCIAGVVIGALNYHLFFYSTWFKQVVTLETLPTPSSEPKRTILFADDFSAPRTNWLILEPEVKSANVLAFQDGTLRITSPERYNVVAYLDRTFPGDVIVEVDLAKIENPRWSPNTPMGDAYGVGLVCRAQSNASRYSVYTQGSGFFYAIYEFVNPSGLVPKLEAGETTWWSPKLPYHLRAECIGNRLTMYVNGHLVLSKTDTSLSSGGRVGLVNFYQTGATTSAWFDNFVVFAP
jgi:hypothetical protein